MEKDREYPAYIYGVGIIDHALLNPLSKVPRVGLILLNIHMSPEDIYPEALSTNMHCSFPLFAGLPPAKPERD